MSAASRPRPLTRAERAVAYALIGGSTEIGFTAIAGLAHRQTRDARLHGSTYLWMAPIYTLCAGLYEPAHDRLRECPVAHRALAYALGILAMEYTIDRLIRRATGMIPWDYTGQSPLAIGGAIRLDDAPPWAAAGIALERVDDALRSARINWVQ